MSEGGRFFRKNGVHRNDAYASPLSNREARDQAKEPPAVQDTKFRFPDDVPADSDSSSVDNIEAMVSPRVFKKEHQYSCNSTKNEKSFF